jgi:hypothetical protein
MFLKRESYEKQRNVTITKQQQLNKETAGKADDMTKHS